MPDTLVIHYVQWRDASVRVGWVGRTALEEMASAPPLINESVGYLVMDCATHITLAMSVNASRAGDLLSIPRENIIEMKALV